MINDEIRSKTVDIAHSFVSLHADPKDPTSYHRYVELIAPGEKPEVQREMALMSGCALVVAGIWRALGVKNRRLDPPYVVGSAISRLRQIASEAGAWVPFAEDRLPSPGDAVLVGGGAGGVEHIYTVVSVSQGEVITLATVDGGQRDEHHNEAICAKSRVWKKDRDIVCAGSDPGAAAGEGRVIDGWIDIQKLVIQQATLPVEAPPAQAPTAGARPTDEIEQTTHHAASSSIDLSTTLGVQQALQQLGFNSGTIDGKDGLHTRAAVTAFQRAHALSADGVVRPSTRKAIADALSRAAAKPAESTRHDSQEIQHDDV